MKNTPTSLIRVSGNFADFKKNLEIRAYMFNRYYKDYVNYLLVDYGDDAESSSLFENFAKNNNWAYHKSGAVGGSLAYGINEGIRASTSQYVILEDIDLIHPPEFYKKINDEIIDGWDTRPFNFYSIPVAYLSEKISAQLESCPELITQKFARTVKNALELGKGGDEELLQHFAPQSSLIICRRQSAEFIGLFDEKFVGWGGEDRDFIFRLLSVNTNIKHNKDFSYTSTESGAMISKYVGWKALWTLHGDFAYNNNILSFHLYHDERKWKDSSARGSARKTMQYAASKAKIIGSNYYKYLTPTPTHKNNVFIFGRNPHLFNEQLYQALGGFELIEENINAADLMHKVNKDSKVIFWNPYGSSVRLHLYKNLKKMGVSTFVAERGALPNSIVFDPSNLVIFSDSYRRELWDKELTSMQEEKTINYIKHMKESSQTLESQGEENNVDLVNLKYSLNKFKKKILVCLQLSTDTVTNQKVDGFPSYPEYIEKVREIATGLPKDCVLLVKNHPLSNSKCDVKGALCVDDVHLHTLLKIVDCVIVYNSGTGIIARLFGKPVITFGPNSYSDKYFTRSCTSSNEFFEILKQNDLPSMDEDKIIKYFSYLINEFYSFANFYDLKPRKTPEATLVYPEKLSYYQIHSPLDNKEYVFCGKRWIPEESILFKRFFNYSLNTNNKPILKETLSNITNSTTSLVVNEKEDVTRKKINKLLHNPYSYFNDSRYPIRWMRYFFTKK